VPSPDWLTYRDEFRHLDQRADLFGDISSLLPTYQTRFAPAARGTLVDGQGHDVASEHGLAFWVRMDLAIPQAEQHFIHGHFRHDGWGAEPVSRSLQIARICDPITGSEFTFAHLHGLRDPEGKGDTPARMAQCDEIIHVISRFRRADEPLILAGDFNLLPDSATFAALKAIGLHDLVTSHGHTDTRTSLYKKAQRYADYLLVTDNVVVRAFELPALPELSDHRPLILDF